MFFFPRDEGLSNRMALFIVFLSIFDYFFYIRKKKIKKIIPQKEEKKK
jgi:hypothetical protein